VQHAGHHHIVNERAAACEQAGILLTGHALPDKARRCPDRVHAALRRFTACVYIAFRGVKSNEGSKQFFFEKKNQQTLARK
jgi:hypothetical protein